MRLRSLAFAVVLQAMPMGRRALTAQGPGAPRAGIIVGWIAGALALLGHFDAVSGASAAVTGLVKYSGSTPISLPTNHVAEPGGEPFRYRITVSNPGTDFAKNYFNCIPLPPGLTMNTNPGGSGFITGTPTVIGTYDVTLLAGNLNYPTPATLPATIVIYPANAPPVVTNQPQSVSVLAGATATFDVGVFGSLPLNYQWQRNGTNLAGKTSATLSLAGVGSASEGDYQVAVTNAFGAVTSAVARLTVRELFTLELRLGEMTMVDGSFQFTVTGPIRTNYVLWGSSNAVTWAPFQTNWVLDGYLRIVDPESVVRQRNFYRASFGP